MNTLKLRLFVFSLSMLACASLFAARGVYHDGGWHGGGWYGGYYVGNHDWGNDSCQNVQVCDANNACWIEQNCN